ncbi:MAG: DUF368 domain-containing protein [Bacilli bacterium]
MKKVQDKIILGIKGFFIGVANIIPGVSGGTMAVSFGIYEELINIASNFFHNFKKNVAFVMPIGIGALLAIALLSNIISVCLDKYKVATPLLFVGLIMGGFPIIFKKIGKKIVKPQNMLCFLITLVFMIFIYMGVKNNTDVNFNTMNIFNYIILFIVGVVGAITMVVPGISGSFVLMLIGYYKPIIETISKLTNFNNIYEFSSYFSNIMILAVFGIGVIVGIVLVSKLIKYCLKHYEKQTYASIVAFVLSSIVLIIYPLFNFKVSVMELVIGIILLLIGSLITYKLEK